MDVETTKIMLKRAIECRITPMLWGKHGIGKSDIIRQVAKEMGFDRVVDLRLGQMEVGDLVGMPERDYYCPNCDKSFGLKPNYDTCPMCLGKDMAIPLVGRTIWLLPSWWPKDNEKVLIFVDEFNRGRIDVQQGAFQLVLDKRIHVHPLPENCAIISASNPSGGDYIVNEMDPALLDRFINIKLVTGHDEWLKWARNNEIQEDIIDFIGGYPSILGNEAVDIPVDIKPTPRSYEFLSKMISGLPEKYWHQCACCIIGDQAAIAFRSSLAPNIDKPVKAKDILGTFSEKTRKTLKMQIKGTKDSGPRIDLIDITATEMVDILKDHSPKYKEKSMKNVRDFLKLIPKDLMFKITKLLSDIEDVNDRLLLPDYELFDILVEAKKEATDGEESK